MNTTDDENLARTLQALWNSDGPSDEEIARQLQNEENQRARRQQDTRSRINTGPSRGNGNCTIN